MFDYFRKLFSRRLERAPVASEKEEVLEETAASLIAERSLTSALEIMDSKDIPLFNARGELIVLDDISRAQHVYHLCDIAVTYRGNTDDYFWRGRVGSTIAETLSGQEKETRLRLSLEDLTRSHELDKNDGVTLTWLGRAYAELADELTDPVSRSELLRESCAIYERVITIDNDPVDYCELGTTLIALSEDTYDITERRELRTRAFNNLKYASENTTDPEIRADSEEELCELLDDLN